MIGGTRLDDPSERYHHSGVSPMKVDPFGPWATALIRPRCGPVEYILVAADD